MKKPAAPGCAAACENAILIDDVAGAEADTSPGGDLDTGDDVATSAAPDTGAVPAATGAENAT